MPAPPVRQLRRRLSRFLVCGLPASCLHCASPRVESHSASTWEIRDVTFSLAVCADCGGVFTVPSPDEAVLRWLYDTQFNYRWYRHHYPAKLLDSVERLREYRRRGDLSGTSILEYGGGLGYMARAARMFGLECATWDPYAGRDDAQVRGRRWDTVFCHHTLEHAADPVAMLDDVSSFLAANARLIVAVPNAGGRGFRERGMDWVWSQPPLVHLHHFTRRGLVELFRRCGYRVTDVRFHDRWDASVLADVRAWYVFRKLDHAWGKLPLPFVTSQLTSAARFLALGGGRLLDRKRPPEDRSELLVVAEKAERSPAAT